MNQTDYLKKALEIKARVAQECQDLHEVTAQHRFRYLQSKHSRSTLLPDLKTPEEEFFQSLMFHRDLAVQDQELAYAYENMKVTGNTSFLADKRPRIYCTFHLGSYRLINFFLHKNRLDYALMINQMTFEAEEHKFQALHTYFKEIKDQSIQFKVLNAESESIAMQMIREVKKGNNLLFYIDGNTGIGGFNRKDDKLVAVEFLNQPILSRKGIAFLSHFLNIPIVPVIAYRQSITEPILEFLNPIDPDLKTDRESYCQKTTQAIWDIFSCYLKKYPEQWEGWLYANNFLSPSPEAADPGNSIAVDDTSTYAFTKSRYSMFTNDNAYYLYNNQTAYCSKISDPLFRFLHKIDHENIALQGINLKALLHESLLNSLIQNNVLSKV
jgi:lauroyl/myristoyl acyltransferase